MYLNHIELARIHTIILYMYTLEQLCKSSPNELGRVHVCIYNLIQNLGQLTAKNVTWSSLTRPRFPVPLTSLQVYYDNHYAINP